MRDIIFRGKRKDTGEWEYGNLVCSKNYAIGSQRFPLQRPEVVDPDTVGQYIGLTDKNGKQIFEGDIIRAQFKSNRSIQSFIVYFADSLFVFDNGSVKVSAKDINILKVIGNIYEAPQAIDA